jgi:hypothetical protein
MRHLSPICTIQNPIFFRVLEFGLPRPELDFSLHTVRHSPADGGMNLHSTTPHSSAPLAVKMHRQSSDFLKKPGEGPP